MVKQKSCPQYGACGVVSKGLEERAGFDVEVRYPRSKPNAGRVSHVVEMVAPKRHSASGVE